MSNDQGTMTVNGPSSSPGSESPRGNGGGNGSSKNKGGLNGATSNNISRNIGDALAKRNGINPTDFTGYFLSADGNVIGISPKVGGDALGVNLGPQPNITTGNGGGSKFNGSIGGAYQGDTSEARKAALIQTVKDNQYWANSTQSGRRITKARQEIAKAQGELAQINYTREDIANAAKITSDFFQEVTQKYSEKASNLAKELANESKGKTLRNVDQAIAAFDKYKNSLGSKFSAKDRTAIANALKSLDYSHMAKELASYNKALGYYGKVTDLYDITQELIKAVETNSWRSFFVKVETLAVGKVATAVTAFAFSMLIGVPLGIIGFAIIMAAVSALVNDKLIASINARLGI